MGVFHPLFFSFGCTYRSADVMIFGYWWGLLIGIFTVIFTLEGSWICYLWYRNHMAFIDKQIDNEIHNHIKKYHQVKK